jgi:integrase
MVIEVRPPASGRITIRDTESPLILRIASSGHRSFCVLVRIGRGDGTQVRVTYPKGAVVENLSDARSWARKTVDDARCGTDPRVTKAAEAKAAETEADRVERLKIENVVANYIKRRAREQKKNRRADDAERLLEIYVVSRWRGRLVTEITRRDVNALLDDAFDRKVRYKGKTFGGNVAADNVLAQIRACFNWYATQDDEFTSPIVPGMARTSPRARKRKRVLSDDEIRALWICCGLLGVYGGLVKTLLLTGQRRDEVAEMSRAKIDENNVWTVTSEQSKNKESNLVPLSDAVLAIIDAQDRIDDCDLVFTTNGETPFSGFSKLKKRLDAAMLEVLRGMARERGEDFEKVALPHWIHHDLRRTAKTRMARAGVRPDISERVLNHVIDGVEGIYDQYDYVTEKRDALTRLAAAIDQIVNPPRMEQPQILREGAA